MRLEDLATPAFVIDLERLEGNIGRMEKRAAALHVGLRPHVKTHKTLEIARLQSRAGITVSTLAEAEFFQEGGFRDIVYAFPVTPDKLDRAARLARRGGFHLILDHDDTAKKVEAHGKAAGLRYSVFLEVDPGDRRSGVDPESPDAVRLARRLHEAEGIDFKGILGHGGQTYRARNREAIVEAAEEERAVLSGFADRLKAEGIPCPEVSAGSTPAALHGGSAEGLTEIRPGNYVFLDKFQADIGACSLSDCAVFVLASVAGRYPSRNELLVDAGALALSKDPGVIPFGGPPRFGVALDDPTLFVGSLSQEHGLVQSETPIAFDRFPIGARLRIVPNHSCLTAALFPRYHVMRRGEVVDEWVPIRGW